MKHAAIISAVALLLAACSGNEDRHSTMKAVNCAKDGIRIVDAWMRPTRLGQPTGAAYLTICNGTDSQITLTGARFAGAQAAELHITKMSDKNIASMVHSTQLIISAGERMIFEPGQAHIMLIGLNDAFLPGDTPRLSLKFKDVGSVTTPLDVTDVTKRDDANH